ncbi:MAG: cupin domain-containing protein [Ferrovibrio sp.]|uniref:cupin domain-containing protein n=1 Tax=Ferrovibrio sp. TaxID=1917215 RepID=UPI002631A9A7|nr:cupin domain-containing protein [Ferrovibrio sp.]MCW0232191.1 cupin domain-containing protein [Ferrovibrio sp.]
MAAANKPKKQCFSLSRARGAKFRKDGLRAFFEYRDLGIGDATHGRYNAEVIRAGNVKNYKPAGRHYHKLDFQLVYVLKGWVKFEYEGEGSFTLKAGDCVLQPPEIRHELTEFSKDIELLEVTSPAVFKTVAVD